MGPARLLLLNAYWHLILKQGTDFFRSACSICPAQRLLASNLKTGRSLDPLSHLDSLTILQAPVENMQ